MRLTQIRKLGRYRNPATGRPVNVHQGQRVGRCGPVIFYLYRHERQFITERDFYHNWEKCE